MQAFFFSLFIQHLFKEFFFLEFFQFFFCPDNYMFGSILYFVHILVSRFKRRKSYQKTTKKKK